MRLALFDLDGTITTKNIFLAFIAYAVGEQRFRKGLWRLGHWILLHYAGLVSRTRIKQIFVAHFFAGLPEAELRRLAAEFHRTRMPGLIRPRALERIRWHREQGDRVIVVSACIDAWVEDWCRENQVELIATGMEMRDGRVTGKLTTKNCYGPEKVRRVRSRIDLSQVSHIFAYGDSRGDREMLAMADERFFRPFE